ncbi:hypothetical protein BCV69DRAFT_284529 [Microstroma glucosiphilum]|uniref:TPR-like protein n=1 Tax=Pseudomicrostroma glucosiphilum TaxID=1684307 RepID=A0A316U0H1_9BASI|nr:hypothetical protein BCV69DRAFT_284529 [Pseudomicrostroma glucosiphilum]PWN18909.1 hypothetical protein BCV69DRAFT_284529 [Pseudomicrostroma glucosiphilum]
MDYGDDGSGERILSIPTEQGDVPIDLADLPIDAEGIADIVGLLAADAQPAHYWATLAYEYLAIKHEDVALEFLTRGSHILRSAPLRRAQGTALLDAMTAAVYANRARSSPKQLIPDARYQPLQGRGIHPKQAHYGQATQFTNSSAASDPKAVHSQLSRAIDMALKGATPDAQRIFNDIAERQPRNSLALLGKACCLLRKRDFQRALLIYQQVLSLVLPYEAKGDFTRPDPRIGIGLCLAGMGRTIDARRAWTRSAELYPNNAAPRLLLGLSSFNAAKQAAALPLGLFGVGQTTTEEMAREAAQEDGLTSMQMAWKLNNRSAMAAVAMAEHFTKRAYIAAQEGNTAKADAQFQQALKLGEHAIQYADARSDLLAAWTGIARTAHVAVLAARNRSITLDEVEMRSVAMRHWTRVTEDLARAPAPGSVPGTVGPLQALASLSLAQLLLSQSEVVAAMHALEGLQLANLPYLPLHLLEPALLEGSLRATSHPGASKEEAQRDRQKARILLERAMTLVEAATSIVEGGLTTTTSTGLAALTKNSLLTEAAGQSALIKAGAVGQDALANVELAQILQNGSSAADLPRAARRYTTALNILVKQRESGDVTNSVLEIRLRANLGAVLGVRALESAVGAGYGGAMRESIDKGNAITHPLVERALEHLRASLDLMKTSSGAASGDDQLEFEKTTVMFNAARLQESSSHTSALEDARQAYETILQIHPEYIDARVRLAIMIASLPASANVKGKATQMANAYFKEALSSDPANLDTRAAYVCFLGGALGSSPYPAQWAMIKDTLAELFLGANDPKAVRTFGGASAARAVAESTSSDPFIMSCMGSAYYNLGREAKDKKERDRCMIRAAEFFSQALAHDSKCVVAAQGLGIILCDDGLVSAAKPGSGSELIEAEREARRAAVGEALAVFTKLRELRDDGSIHVCLGHALSKREEWERASKAYEIASKQYYDDSNPHVLTYLAFSDYHLGLQLKSYSHLLKSVGRLQSARGVYQAQRNELVGDAEGAGANGTAAPIDSSNPRILSLEAEIKYNRYNEAVIKQKALQMMLEVRKEERSLEELKSAAEGIKEGLTIFADLVPSARAGQLNFITEDVIEQRIQYGESLAERQAPQHIEEQQTFEAEVAAKSEAVKALRNEKARAREEAERAAAEEEAQRLEMVKESRRKAMEEAREFQYRLPSPEPVKKKRGEGGGGGGAAGGKKRRKRAESGEIETDEEERRLNEAVGSDEDDAPLTDDDDDIPGKAGRGGSDDEEDAAAKAQRREEKKLQRKRNKMEELKAARKESAKRRKKAESLEDGTGGGGKSGKKSKSSSSKGNSSQKSKKKKMKKKRIVSSDEEDEDDDEDARVARGDGQITSDDDDDDDGDDDDRRGGGAGNSDEEEEEEEEQPQRKKQRKSSAAGVGRKRAPKVADLDLIDSDEEM